MDYAFFQQYWWLLVSLLGALLVFLLFVQGGQTFIFATGKDPLLQKMIVNSTGRKWEFTLTTLVTFGGAYWVWTIICLCFVIQAVSYEFQSKNGNVWGKKVFQSFLLINGILAPLLLGAAVSTFFTGGNFIVDKGAITSMEGALPIISVWQPYMGVQLHGLEAVLNPWNLVLGVAVLFLSRTTALLYFINNIDDEKLYTGARKQLLPNAALFVVFFVTYVGFVLTTKGLTYDASTRMFVEEDFKYLHNFLQMPAVAVVFVAGVALVLLGVVKTLLVNRYKKGIWFHGVGVVLAVLGLLLIAGWNNTAFYPSIANPQSSLALANSSSSFYTLKAMSIVSLIIPFVLAYIFYAWRALDLRKINRKEMEESHHTY